MFSHSINSILLVDKKSNIERIEKLVKTIDKTNSAEIKIIKLENLSSIEAVRILEKLKTQNNPTISNFIAVPFTPSNSVILSADSAVTNNITKTLRTLDQDSLSGGSINVIYLKYSKADEVAAIISSVSARFSGEESSKPVITSHRETNSLIISAEETTMDAIKNLVAKLDIRRAQVLVEAIIVELSETAAKIALIVWQRHPNLYFEVHNQFMQLGPKMRKGNVVNVLNNIDLNGEEIFQEADSLKLNDVIEANIKLAQSLGLRGTPATIVNNSIYPGYLPYKTLETLIK